ncbi:hypothetical protein [Deinococcus pimensis]|uniref:hypothetical protein n=1 Tax=Deinococcus pimensis TaxID=309888 RepID=UPI0004852F92|nr:hypothetical protein [Deinococcus pimensis]
MSITIVLMEGKTLHVEAASPSHVERIREVFAQGRGSFEFSVNGRVYVVNASNILYVEVVGS